jgi:hypothetical protein
MIRSLHLAGLLATVVPVSAGVIKIPLKPRAQGANIPVTDWFNRTDNQVCTSKKQSKGVC